LLNPDTVVEIDTFHKCIAFMDQHPDAGGLGVKMVDGSGKFLPESKRGLPTPWVSLYKVLRLHKLFPKSKVFGRYYLGYLNEDQTNEVEILVGAFMMMRRTALDKAGLLDERFFLFWEDTDLAYRIVKAGFKNYYFADTTIIHYKGESTVKTTPEYIFTFYNSMLLFAKKHFSNNHLFQFSIFISMYLLAGTAYLRLALRKVWLPLLDIASMYFGMYFLKTFWEDNYKDGPNFFPEELMTIAVPLYILTWLISVYYSGGYDKPYKPFRIIRGVLLGTILISATTNFFTEFRFSRALIVLGGVYATISFLFLRALGHYIKHGSFNLGVEKGKRLVVVGSPEECMRVIGLLKDSNVNANVLGFISSDENSPLITNQLGTISKLSDLAKIFKIEEVIFCLKDISVGKIIASMAQVSGPMEFRIVPDGVDYVIGSPSSTTKGDIYSINLQLAILQENNRRNKRVLDMAISSILLIASPLLVIFLHRRKDFFRNLFSVISGKYSWVGYSLSSDINLPRIKTGVLSPSSTLSAHQLDQETVRRLDFLYARDYRASTDLSIILHSLGKLDQKVA